MIQSIRPVGSDAFGPYGRVVAGYRFDGLLQVLREHTPRPSDGTVYVASDPRLERLPVFGEVQAGFFGGLPAQFGYCNGVNTRLACCEYHQCSELLVAADDLVLVVGPRGGISGGVCDTAGSRRFPSRPARRSSSTARRSTTPPVPRAPGRGSGRLSRSCGSRTSPWRRAETPRSRRSTNGCSRIPIPPRQSRAPISDFPARSSTLLRSSPDNFPM